MINTGNYPFTTQVCVKSSLTIEGKNILLPKMTINLLTILTLQQEQAMDMSKKHEMFSSMIFAILQDHNITFIVTSSMIRTYNQTSQQ
jgi:hypothetical protein